MVVERGKDLAINASRKTMFYTFTSQNHCNIYNLFNYIYITIILSYQMIISWALYFIIITPALGPKITSFYVKTLWQVNLPAKSVVFILAFWFHFNFLLKIHYISQISLRIGQFVSQASKPLIPQTSLNNYIKWRNK